MALVDTQEVTLAISAQTTGQADVAALANQVEALAREGGDAAPKFQALAQELRTLGQQQVRIDGLQAAIGSAKSAHAAVRDARHEVQVLDKALGDAKGAGAGREAIRLLEKELAAANRQLNSAERAWTSQKAALAAARTETQAAGINTAKLAEEQKRLDAALVATTGRLEAERAAAAAANPALKTLGTAADQAGAALGRLGIRSADHIQAEINAINRDLVQLSASAKVTGSDFDRAWAAGQKRIAALKAEMAGAADPFINSMNRAGVEVDGLATKLRPLAGALAAAFSVQQGVQALTDANLQAERLTRSLATIATPAHSAREQLEWLRDMAERNGVAFDRLGQSFISFAASTRGTALEGQKTREIYDAIVTSMGRMGRTSDEVAHALQAVSQMASKGTVSMEELRGQLSEAMPGALQSLARGLGLTTEQLIKMVSEGRLLAEDALPALQRELQKTIDATGEDKVAGMEAGWNRLTNAIRRALDAGQEKRNTTGEVLDWLAERIDGLGDRAGGLEISWAGLVRALQTGDWGDYTAAVEAHAAAVAASKDTAALAAEQHRILGAAALQAGAQAQQAEAAWVALDNGYTQILVHVREQIALAEKNAIARQAEGTAAVALAQAFGTEAEQRHAAVTAATGNAEALKAVALQRQTEVATLQAQIVAQRESMVANKDESNAHKESIAALQTQLAVRQADAERATAQAGASRLAAEAARAEAAAQADNSSRVAELRTAYEAARTTLETVRAARAANKVEAEALTVAELAAGRAAHAYRDALNDQAAAIKANLSVKQAQNQLDQTNVQLSIAVAQRAYELAKAKGDERTATEELLRIKQLEVRLAELQAQALKAQAAAELIAVRNKREHAEASGTLTDQLRAELRAEQLAAEAKAVQGEISMEVAGKLRELADAADESGAAIVRSMDGAAEATGRIGTEAQKSALDLEKMGEAAANAAEKVESAENTGGRKGGKGGRNGYEKMDMGQGALFARAEQIGGLALRREAEASALKLARDGQTLMSTKSVMNAMSQWFDGWNKKLDSMQIAQERKQNESLSATAPASGSRGGSMSGNTQYSAPSAGVQAPGPRPERTVQVNLNIGGRGNIPVFTNQTDADRLIAALESSSMRAS